ncbi:MAG: nicotinamide-nucleotide amidohydrolase family protein [Clostridia bacterium]|nr:nicotinamide-nucleotide amidohydrolase family protein [Clostridia bacterium]
MIDKVLAHLIENKITVATAESCTAGLIAARIGDANGVSEIFSEGYVTYSNQAKEKNLGVPRKLLEEYGAVSEQVARAMAEGVCRVSGAELGLSATGIAGPTGGTDEKPVGLVYMGVCYKGKTSVVRRVFKGSRAQVRASTVEAVFAEVKNRLQI